MFFLFLIVTLLLHFSSSLFLWFCCISFACIVKEINALNSLNLLQLHRKLMELIKHVLEGADVGVCFLRG